jgi:hypothetical protein
MLEIATTSHGVFAGVCHYAPAEDGHGTPAKRWKVSAETKGILSLQWDYWDI